MNMDNKIEKVVGGQKPKIISCNGFGKMLATFVSALKKKHCQVTIKVSRIDYKL